MEQKIKNRLKELYHRRNVLKNQLYDINNEINKLDYLNNKLDIPLKEKISKPKKYNDQIEICYNYIKSLETCTSTNLINILKGTGVTSNNFMTVKMI